MTERHLPGCLIGGNGSAYCAAGCPLAGPVEWDDEDQALANAGPPCTKCADLRKRAEKAEKAESELARLQSHGGYVKQREARKAAEQARDRAEATVERLRGLLTRAEIALRYAMRDSPVANAIRIELEPPAESPTGAPTAAKAGP